MCSYSVESVVDDMLEVLAHANLPHQLVLVAIHPCQLADVGKGVLQTISQLESIHVTKAILDVGVNYQFGESKNFTTQVEGVAETRLLPLLQRHNSLLQHTHACTHAHVPVQAPPYSSASSHAAQCQVTDKRKHPGPHRRSKHWTPRADKESCKYILHAITTV